jgi:hypothetical protein
LFADLVVDPVVVALAASDTVQSDSRSQCSAAEPAAGNAMRGEQWVTISAAQEKVRLVHAGVARSSQDFACC